MRCPQCGIETDQETCPVCGYDLVSGSKDTGSEGVSKLLKRLKNSLSVLLLVTFLGFLVLNTAILIWTVGWIPPQMIDAETLIWIVLLIPVGLFKLGGVSFVVYYLLLVISILFSFIYLFYKGGSDLVQYIKDALFSGEKDSENMDTQVPRLAFVFAALLFFTYVYYTLLISQGSSPKSPSFEQMQLWELIYGFTRAAVWEELTIRVVFVGLPMFLYAKAQGTKKSWKYLYGGFGLKERFVLFPIIVSSLIFAVAHLGSWDYMKLVPSFVAGLAFAYLYAKDGLHSAILLHFIWDYLSVPLKVSNVPNGNMIMNLLILFWMVVGVYYVYYYSKKGIMWFKTDRTRAHLEGGIGEPKEKKEIKEKTYGIDTFFVCPNCGGNRAIYTGGGRLECTRCGHKEGIKVEERENTDKKNQEHPVKKVWPPDR